MSKSSIRPIDRTLSGITTPYQSGPGSDGNEEVLFIHKSCKYWRLSIRLFSVISRTLVCGDLTPLLKCSRCNTSLNKSQALLMKHLLGKIDFIHQHSLLQGWYTDSNASLIIRCLFCLSLASKYVSVYYITSSLEPNLFPWSIFLRSANSL